MDKVRELIKDGMRKKGMSMKALSESLGRNHAYIQQFIERHSPAKLPPALAPKLAALLEIPLRELVDNDLLHIDNISRSGEGYTGFSDDAESYILPPKSDFSDSLSNANLSPFKIRTAVLDAIGVKPGDVRLFSMSKKSIENLRTGDVVVCQAFNQDGAAKTVIRQFIAPSKLMANSTIMDYTTIDLTKEDIHIRGVMVRGESGD